MKKILGCLRRAVEDFNMMEEGDRIAVGVSGGKDSLILFKGLRLYQYMSPVKYELEAITLDMGYDGTDWTEVGITAEAWYTLYHKETNIAKIVFDVRQEKNPAPFAPTEAGALTIQPGLNCKRWPWATIGRML